MKVNLLRFFINLFQFNRTNWKAVALCFLAAVVFWLFTAFNKSYSTNIRFPIHFEYDRERYVPYEHLPPSIVINVSGKGWDLFIKHFGLKVPEINIPLEKPLEVKKIVGATLTPQISGQIGSLNINYVVNDTLSVYLDVKDIHKYKVIADEKDVSFKSGLGKISPVVILPDSVTLEGPKRFLHEMPDTLSITIPKQKLSKNFREEVEVVIPHGDLIRRNPPIVEIMFEVGEVKRVEMKIKISYIKKINTYVKLDSLPVMLQVPVSRMTDFESRSKQIVAEPVGTDNTFVVRNLPEYVKLDMKDSATFKTIVPR